MRSILAMIGTGPVLCTLVLCSVVHAQDSKAEESEYVRLYNEATALDYAAQREATAPEAKESYRQCAHLAIDSYMHKPSKLALWRILSCGAGAGQYLVAWAAMDDYQGRYGEPLESFRHEKFDKQEVERVTSGANETRRRVGGVRPVLPEGWEIQWSASQPFDLGTGQWFTLTRATLLQRGEVIYGLANTSAPAVAKHSVGRAVQLEVAFHFSSLAVSDVESWSPSLDSAEPPEPEPLETLPPASVSTTPLASPIPPVILVPNEATPAPPAISKCQIMDADLDVDPADYARDRPTMRRVAFATVGLTLGVLGAFTIMDASKVHENDRTSREYNPLGRGGAMGLGAATLAFGTSILVFPMAGAIKDRVSVGRLKRARRDELARQRGCMAELRSRGNL